jgi:uncharacterized membrane protein
MKRAFIILSLLTFSFFFFTCTHDPYYLNDPEPIVVTSCNPDTVYFVNDVLPLLQSGCALSHCHDTISKEHGVIMTDYVNIIQTGHVKPGKAKSSKLYKVITGGGEEAMPPSPQPKFTSEQTDLIKKWIDQGAWNLECLEENCDTTIYTFSGAIWPTIQNKCLGCHSGSNPGAGIMLTNHQEIAAVAAEPRFMGALTHTAPYKPMPQTGNQLSDCKITQFNKWIADGMLDN